MKIETSSKKFLTFILLVVAANLVSAFAQENRRPVPIEFPTDGAFLPSSWAKAPIQAKIRPLDQSLQAQAARIITKGLLKYPHSLSTKYLKGVTIVGSLEFYGVKYGGTYMVNAKKVILVYRKTFDPRGFEQRLHHEFSSILLKMNQDSFENPRWIASNPPDFKYRAEGIIEEQSGQRPEATKVLAAEQQKTGGSGSSLLRLTPQLMTEGFLTPYNRVSIEQDVNETAAHLFTNPEIWRFCQSYPRLDQKVDVLIDFYRSLDPKMDRLYFRKLTRKPRQTFQR